MNSTILLVEDNPADAELAIRAFQKNNFTHHIVHLEDGQEALNTYMILLMRCRVLSCLM